MNSISDRVPWLRLRRLGVGLLLLTLSACGLSNYEDLMHKAEEREDQYREEQKYLDEPVFPPLRKVQGPKEKAPHDEPVATVFFRPPKGIISQPKRINDFLSYYPKLTSPVFSRVEMAFAKDDKSFSTRVLNAYPVKKQVTRHPSLPFDTCEACDSKNEYCYSINIWTGTSPAKTQVAIIYVYSKLWQDKVREQIDMSLRSLAVDQDVIPVRTRYNKKSPWRLSGPLEP